MNKIDMWLYYKLIRAHFRLAAYILWQFVKYCCVTKVLSILLLLIIEGNMIILALSSLV